ncbi:MAG: carboxypeptidase-like regulatory domain-containing protein, partial [Capnocytophaga sp.]|nr:carboxypeptidase-like regulatory domain-containing protein [Capnocytophaga sp.]
MSAILFGQNSIQGKVYDSQKSPIELVNVLLSDSTDTQVITYGTTQTDGSYFLKTTNEGKMYIKYSFLGYDTHSKEIIVKKGRNILADVLLTEKAFVLEEVVVRTEPPISQRQDTVKIVTKYFTDGTEKNVEDMLKKIPGLQIESDGTVKVGNKEIEKIMVEGDDFFEKGYKILSKSM